MYIDEEMMLHRAYFVWYLEKPLNVLDRDFGKLKVWKRAQREAYFNFWDENGTFLIPKISQFLSLNLWLWDENKNFLIGISGLKTQTKM